MNVGNPRHKNTVSESVLCHHDREMSAKSANIWLLGRHVADMSPTFPAKFIIPKLDSTVRTISDFRELNKHMVRKPYPIPKISMILQELEGFTYATAFGLNMGYYTIRLDPMASEMCTIIP